MNYDLAYTILEIDDNKEITIDIIKRQYKKNALIYHPDKNKTPQATQKFQDISDAYQFLIKNNPDNHSIDNYDDLREMLHNMFYESSQYSNNVPKSEYTNILFSFLENVVGKDIFSNVQNKIFYMIIQKLCLSCEPKALELLKKLDTTTIQKIYNILEMHQEVFHFSETFLDSIKSMMMKNTDNWQNPDERIIIYTFLDDLMQNNLYRLTVNQKQYIIPLWFHELVYDQDEHDIIVQCIPILPDNMNIDENNNLVIQLSYTITELLANDEIVVKTFGYGKKIAFKPENLKICKTQSWIILREGISKINPKNIYDVSKKGNIILNITIIA